MKARIKRSMRVLSAPFLARVEHLVSRVKSTAYVGIPAISLKRHSRALQLVRRLPIRFLGVYLFPSWKWK